MCNKVYSISKAKQHFEFHDKQALCFFSQDAQLDLGCSVRHADEGCNSLLTKAPNTQICHLEKKHVFAGHPSHSNENIRIKVSLKQACVSSMECTLTITSMSQTSKIARNVVGVCEKFGLHVVC